MNLIERVKNIIITPKTEWEKIATEEQSLSSVISTYVVPLAVAGAIATFIGWAFIGIDYGFFRMKGIGWGVKMAVIQLISSIVGVIVTAFIVDALAPSFGSEKNINRSAQLVAYGYTPSFIGALLGVLPSIGWLGGLFGLYGIYLIYLGLGPMKKTPEDKKVIYMVVTIVILIVVYLILGLILGSLLGTRLPAASLSL
ncbi:YIP1 family protein [Ferruginibacter lapsinanis]|uniref:Yip1 family protein n=1 Tax=Ferruginibacter lapsinanis TaxID=563172 RepID=UPI001E467BE3|nr:Yip1 family protein [Ferruginibacter lapsinanis]UEG50591.1 YIP1 family protein [Ferruginibacter lapsinanis]